jgi:hypothetical protein
MNTQEDTHPVRFSVDYPDRPLNRVTTAFRIFVAIPIFIVLAAVSGGVWQSSQGDGSTAVAAAGGLLFFGPLLMILFRQKYPRWWFDWNLELQRFTNRVAAYVSLMDDRYPSTTDHQSVHLDYDYPDAARDLNRWLPLVKWFLAIPHFIVLVVLNIAAVFVVILVWFAILFTGRYPHGLLDYIRGPIRWHNRVIGYAFILVTDQYPPFQLRPLTRQADVLDRMLWRDVHLRVSATPSTAISPRPCAAGGRAADVDSFDHKRVATTGVLSSARHWQLDVVPALRADNPLPR